MISREFDINLMLLKMRLNVILYKEQKAGTEIPCNGKVRSRNV